MSERPYLTDRRRRILRVIKNSIRDRGYPPTFQEIAAEVGLSSTSSVKLHIDHLVQDGYITTDPMKPRTIQIVFEDAPT